MSCVDLVNHEVKSAKSGGSYEYQYHKHTGREKLVRDMDVGHLFFDYSPALDHVDLRYLHGSELQSVFSGWLDRYPDPYPQRYRKSISFGYVKKHGRLLMTIEDGEVVYPVLAPSF